MRMLWNCRKRVLLILATVLAAQVRAVSTAITEASDPDGSRRSLADTFTSSGLVLRSNGSNVETTSHFQTERNILSGSEHPSVVRDEGKDPEDSTLQPRVALYHATADGLYKYGMTLLFIFGTAGNVLALLVLLLRMRNAPGTPYLIALGVIDQYNIFSAVLGSHMIRSFTGFDYIRFHRSACKFAYFSIVTCAQSSFYLVAMMSLERALVVTFPLRFLHTFSVRKSSLIIVAIVIVWVGKNLNLIWSQGAVIVPDENGTMLVKSECGISRGPTYYFGTQIRPWLDYAITLFAALVIVISNGVIISVVCKSIRMRKKTASAMEGETDRKAMQMIPMLVTTSLAFFILALPLQVVTILYPSNPNDLEGAALARLLWAVGLLTNYMNNGVNFYLYCVSGSLFRKQLILLFRRGRKTKSEFSSVIVSYKSDVTNVAGSVAHVTSKF